ncbi:MAG: hypothetical protein H6732_10415 [Alphaproteobacteria bacterium]|nr:hypothetical protein [Alphaproteobacteria bacterium]
MSRLATIRQIAAFAREDANAHAGDIAILKLDLFGVDARPALRGQLAPVRGWLPSLDVAALRALPVGTFGRAYADFLDAHGLSPLVLSDTIDAATRARNTYGIRYAATHDMFHVLLGYGPDWVGELGVLAFTCGQDYARTLWAQAAMAWLIYPFRSGFRLGALLGAWRRGYQLGRRAPFLLGVRLEDRFDTPLDDLRAELGLVDDRS